MTPDLRHAELKKVDRDRDYGNRTDLYRMMVILCLKTYLLELYNLTSYKQREAIKNSNSVLLMKK